MEALMDDSVASNAMMDDSMASDSMSKGNGEGEYTVIDTRQGPDSRFPPGFHFQPRDDELILCYLRRKMAKLPLFYDVFNDVNLYEHHPATLAEKFKEWGENRWYFFTPRDRKYPNGIRPNRKTVDGYWKATGVEKKIMCNAEQVGVRKALVFYTGKAGKGTKTDWIMYEYINQDPSDFPRRPDGTMKLDEWVLCTIQKKRGADDEKIGELEEPSKAQEATTSQSTEIPRTSDQVDYYHPSTQKFIGDYYHHPSAQNIQPTNILNCPMQSNHDLGYQLHQTSEFAFANQHMISGSVFYSSPMVTSEFKTQQMVSRSLYSSKFANQQIQSRSLYSSPGAMMLPPPQEDLFGRDTGASGQEMSADDNSIFEQNMGVFGEETGAYDNSIFEQDMMGIFGQKDDIAQRLSPQDDIFFQQPSQDINHSNDDFSEMRRIQKP